MKAIEWDDRISIDGGSIDDDHKKLINIINEFLSKEGTFQTADELVEILVDLYTHAHDHFRREEEVQRLIKFPDRDTHYSEHVRLSKKLEKLIEQTRPTSGNYINVMGDRVSEFVHEWLFDHILQSDMKMKPFVKRAGLKIVKSVEEKATDATTGEKRIVAG